MAGNTVGKITNSFLPVLGPDIGFVVFVAAITGVAAVVVGQMAGTAPTVVVTVKHKVGRVVKGGRKPLVGAVAFTTFFLK